MKNQQLDDYMVQQIISRLILPFEYWDAYKFGIIDKKGKVLRKKNTLKTQQEKDSWGNLDILCCNLKKILMSYPTTQMKLAQLNIIQHANIPTVIGQPPTYPLSLLKNFFLLKEDAPANSAGGGNIAGIGVGVFGEPPVKKRRKTIASILFARRELERGNN